MEAPGDRQPIDTLPEDATGHMVFGCYDSIGRWISIARRGCVESDAWTHWYKLPDPPKEPARELMELDAYIRGVSFYSDCVVLQFKSGVRHYQLKVDYNRDVDLFDTLVSL